MFSSNDSKDAKDSEKVVVGGRESLLINSSKSIDKGTSVSFYEETILEGHHESLFPLPHYFTSLKDKIEVNIIVVGDNSLFSPSSSLQVVPTLLFANCSIH